MDQLSFLRLRIVVLALGEVTHAGWWKSQFLSPTGLSFLRRLYPRSAFAAATRSATLAARAVHDTSVGRGNVFHLFRLPTEQERAFTQGLIQRETELATQLESKLSNREQLMQMLAELTSHTAPKQTSVGPVRLGSIRELRAANWVTAFADAYYAAFRDNVKVFPFVENESSH